MTWTVSSDEIICSAMKDATDCHAIEPEENQAKKKLLEFLTTQASVAALHAAASRPIPRIPTSPSVLVYVFILIY